ncbi:MAG: DUF4349 domain-containing protein [Polyangiaceae bacterium]
MSRTMTTMGNRAACLIAMALSVSSVACGGAMKSRSPTTVQGDFERSEVRPDTAMPAPSEDRPRDIAASTGGAASARQYMTESVLAGKAVRNFESAEEDDDRIADNSPPGPKLDPAPPRAPSRPSGPAPSVVPGSGGDGLSGAAVGVRGPVHGAPKGQVPPPLPPPGPPNSTLPKPPAPPEAPNKQQLLVYTANLQMAVYLVEPGLSAVEKIARDFGGYLSSRGDNRIEIRVPREKFNEALKAVEATGDVLHRDVQASDVTDQYVDMESRLRNAKVIRARLQALLERAQVKEALEIERELGRVTQEIEVLEGKLKLLRDKVAFSTITVQYAPKAQALQKTAFALPFPWLSTLGLPHLLHLRDHKGDD